MNDISEHQNRITGTYDGSNEYYQLIPESKDRCSNDSLDICRSDGSIRQVTYSDIHDREFSADGFTLLLLIAFGKPVKCTGQNLQKLAQHIRNRKIPRLYIYNAGDYETGNIPDDDEPVITDIEEVEK